MATIVHAARAQSWRASETTLFDETMKPKTSKRTKLTPVKTRKPVSGALLKELRGLILEAREGVARTVNSGMELLYWHIGKRIRQDILKEKRAEYGEKIVSALGTQLEREFARGFSQKNIHRMVQFAEVFPDRKIVVSLIRQLGWTHFMRIIPIDDPLKRDFYAERAWMPGRLSNEAEEASRNHLSGACRKVSHP